MSTSYEIKEHSRSRKQLLEQLGHFLILLTPMNTDEIENRKQMLKLKNYIIDAKNVKKRKLPQYIKKCCNMIQAIDTNEQCFEFLCTYCLGGPFNAHMYQTVWDEFLKECKKRLTKHTDHDHYFEDGSKFSMMNPYVYDIMNEVARRVIPQCIAVATKEMNGEELTEDEKSMSYVWKTNEDDYQF